MQQRPTVGVRPTEDLIRSLAARKCVHLTDHVIKRLMQRRINLASAIKAIATCGCITQEWPDDPRGHKCKVECVLPDGVPLHMICAVVGADTRNEIELSIITVYVPDAVHRGKEGLR